MIAIWPMGQGARKRYAKCAGAVSSLSERTNVVRIFPNEAAVTRLVGAILAEQFDEWAVCRRYMTLKTLAQISDPDPGPLTIAA